MKNGLLVKISFSQWTGRKKDQDATAEVENNHGTTGAGTFYKQLISKDSIQTIATIVSKARTEIDKNTLPWNDDGTRLLPAKNYMDFTALVRDYKNQFEEAVTRFCDDYDNLISEAQRRLNGLFKTSDYPTRQEIEGKFRYTVSFYPMPESGDFRLDLDHETREALETDLAERLQQTHKEAMGEAFTRLHDAIKHLHNRCEALNEHQASNAPDKGRAPRFAESVIGNLAELTDILPRLNIANNPELDRLCTEAKARLTKYQADDLKESPTQRLNAMRAADDILQQMAGIYGGGN